MDRKLGGDDIFIKVKNLYTESDEINYQICSLYFLIVSRANIDGICYTTANELSKVVESTKNRSRQLIFIKNSLKLLATEGVLRTLVPIDSLGGADTLIIEICTDFTSWKPFYNRYFDIYYELGAIPFNLYMMIVFYNNIDTNSAFFSQEFAREVLKVRNTAIKDGFYLLQQNGYIQIKKSGLYWSERHQTYRKLNNEYKILK